MELMFNECLSLSSFPDISKFIKNDSLSFKSIFNGCISLLLIPDLSKWKNNYNYNNDDEFYNILNDKIGFYPKKQEEEEDEVKKKEKSLKFLEDILLKTSY